MPLIEICALPPDPGLDLGAVMRTLNAAVADAIPCRPEAVWTTWRSLDGGYAAGPDAVSRQPSDTHGPVVHVYVNRPPDAVERACAVIEDVLARELGLAAGNVFVTVQPVFAAPLQ